MNSITIDGMEELEFRRSIETMLRRGEADEAAARLRRLLVAHAGEDRILPQRFLSVTASDIRIEGWDQLADRLQQYDRPEAAMSAISIDILDPQGVGVRPDDRGWLKPVIETSYFSDSAFPFSQSSREDLLDGYSTFGCEWQGNCDHVDTTISVEGIDDLYGAMVDLENRVANSAKADPAEIEAGSLGSCYLAVLIHQAIRDTARKKGLPRPICVLAGSHDAYPFFDAPAMTAEEYCSAHGIEIVPLPDAAAQFQAKFDEDETEDAIGMASLESLIGLGTGKREKKPVLAIDPTEADTAQSLEAQLPDFAKYTGRNHIPTDLSPSDILPSALPADFGRLPCETLPEATQLHMPPAGPSAGESKLPIGFAHKDEAIHHQEDSRHLVMQRGSRASGHPAATGNQQEAEAPLDLLQFDCLEGPNSGNPAAACGLTIHEEAGDKLPWPTGAPGATEPRQTLVQKPARHAIRVIAASVQSGNGTHKPPTTLRGAELILRLAHAMITLLTSMKRWIARR